MPKESYAINIKSVWIKDPHDIYNNFDKLIEDETFKLVVFDSRLAAIKYAKEYLFDLFVHELDNMTTMLGEINDFTNDDRLLLFRFSLYNKNNDERTADFEVSLKHVAMHYAR